jgi:hypothetical protein
MTEAEHRSTPELVRQFLQAALELYDSQHVSTRRGVISMYKVGSRIGLEDVARLKDIPKRLIKTGLLAQDPHTAESGYSGSRKKAWRQRGDIGESELGESEFSGELKAEQRPWWRRLFG